ncbi:hypothetical protein ACWFMI_23495 [Nocardiopsis terrae]|uniref:hypothetical protein n=1 Tax=Streptomyces sp. NPDC057554 TaxID=3350538 RepID=UPI0036760EDF
MLYLNHDLRISGALRAGNISSGSVSVTPTPNSPTPFSIGGFSLRGEGQTRVFVTANTLVPGTVLEVSVNNVTPTGFTLWVYRTNSTSTIVRWLAIRDRI